MTAVRSARWAGMFIFVATVCSGLSPASRGETLTLKNGMTVEGSGIAIVSMKDPLKASDLQRIRMVDNQLTRTFFANNQVVTFNPSPAISMERIKVEQRVATTGRPISSVGPNLRDDPFDEWGRRTYSMSGTQGPVEVVQGITEITPKWTKLEAIQGTNSYIWTMRIATSSIPRDQLSKILYRVLDAKNADERLRIVRLYLQSERFQDARAELDQLLKDFPDLAHLNDQKKMLRQLEAQRLVREIELRRDAGQYRLEIAMLEQFPQDGVAGETLLKVKEMLDGLAGQQTQGQKLLALLRAHVAALKDDKAREQAQAIVEEIAGDLNFNNLDRMADYVRLADDDRMSAEQKVSLGISGWLLGSGAGIDNLAVSNSLAHVRNLIRKYLATTRKPDRDAILTELNSFEGATPNYVARLIAHMKPPLDIVPGPAAAADVGNPAAVLGLAPPQTAKPAQGKAADQQPAAAAKAPPGSAAADPNAAPAAPTDANGPAPDVQAPGAPGLFQRTVKGLSEDPEIKYWVQLPPEYDPYRRYPCVVTLNGAGRTPLQQIDWWAGEYLPEAQARFGQATRHSYIVIAPQWTREHQRKYEYSAREHAAVLLALRDACKRVSIDTDRVFLSGHSMGGDAAWDIGLAHPDLWAGVMPIVAVAEQYVKHKYREHAAYVPLYFVCGEKDGNKLALDADEWDYYLTHRGFDTMIVQYEGRGHEHFHDEIQNLFTWMNLHKRNFFPKDFTVYSLRPWDNFFWWVETAKPLETNVVLPAEWGKRATPAQTEAHVLPTNSVRVSPGTGKVTVWLSPEMVNFDNKVTVTINNRPQRNIQPDVPTLLEDVRTRGDRQHPFWAKVEN